MIALAILAFWAWVWFMGFCIAVSLVWLILKGLFYVLISPIALLAWMFEVSNRDKTKRMQAEWAVREEHAQKSIAHYLAQQRRNGGRAL